MDSLTGKFFKNLYDIFVVCVTRGFFLLPVCGGGFLLQANEDPPDLNKIIETLTIERDAFAENWNPYLQKTYNHSLHQYYLSRYLDHLLTKGVLDQLAGDGLAKAWSMEAEFVNAVDQVHTGASLVDYYTLLASARLDEISRLKRQAEVIYEDAQRLQNSWQQVCSFESLSWMEQIYNPLAIFQMFENSANIGGIANPQFIYVSIITNEDGDVVGTPGDVGLKDQEAAVVFVAGVVIGSVFCAGEQSCTAGVAAAVSFLYQAGKFLYHSNQNAAIARQESRIYDLQKDIAALRLNSVQTLAKEAPEMIRSVCQDFFHPELSPGFITQSIQDFLQETDSMSLRLQQEYQDLLDFQTKRHQDLLDTYYIEVRQKYLDAIYARVAAQAEIENRIRQELQTYIVPVVQKIQTAPIVSMDRLQAQHELWTRMLYMDAKYSRHDASLPGLGNSWEQISYRLSEVLR